MDSKLTLSLDKSVIEEAKKYAKSKQTSLSRLIESYLANLTNKVDSELDLEVTPLVKSLSGVINLSGKTDLDQNYTDYLSEKYT